MTKQDRLNLIAGKCFNNSSLTDEECDLLHSMKISDLVSQGYSLNQAEHMMKCCKRNMLRRRSQFIKSEEC